MKAAHYGIESVVTTLITHRLGLWVPVWKGLSRGSRERDRLAHCPTEGEVQLRPFWKRGVFLPSTTQVLTCMPRMIDVCS